MASPDRRRARVLYDRAQVLGLATIGFLVATLIYPSRPYILPSTFMAIVAGGAALLVASVATMLWKRDR
jgi:hypothetical protein